MINEIELQVKVDKIVAGLKKKIESSVVSVPDFEITKLPSCEKDLSFVKLHSPNRNSFEIESFIVELNRIIFRVEKDIEKVIELNDKELDFFTTKTSKAVPTKLIDELHVFKTSLPPGKVVKLHLILPNEVLEIFSYKENLKRRYFFDMMIHFGLWAEVDGKIFTYKCEPDYCEPDGPYTYQERILIDDIIVFVESEKSYMSSPEFCPEGYANKVLNRFKNLAPTAVLIFGDEPTDRKEYVRCRTDNTWEFSLLEPYISFEIKTDSSILVGDSRYVRTLPEGNKGFS